MFTPLEYEFFVRGLIVATLVGGLCGLIGVYVVLRQMSYIGHGLAHAIFGGAVTSYVLSINFFLGASLWGFVSAMLINMASRRRSISADAAIGIVTTSSFALGIALISRFRNFTRSFDAALFGNILGITQTDMFAIIVVTIAAAAAVFVGYKYLLFTTFDYEVAGFYGVPTGWIDAGFALLLAAVIVVSLQVLGVNDDRRGHGDSAGRRPASDKRFHQDALYVGVHRGILRSRRPVHELLYRRVVGGVGGLVFRDGVSGRARIHIAAAQTCLVQVETRADESGQRSGVASLSGRRRVQKCRCKVACGGIVADTRSDHPHPHPHPSPHPRGRGDS